MKLYKYTPAVTAVIWAMSSSKAHMVFWNQRGKKSIETTAFQFQLLLFKMDLASSKIEFQN